MAAKIWPTASKNAFSTTLNGSINDTVTTVTLTSVTTLSTSGGIIVIDRQDGSGNNTPNTREYISYTGVSGSDLTGVTRGVAGSTAQSHNSGALAEEPMSVTHWLDMQTYLYAEHTATGTHVMSTPTITTTRLITNLNASGASGVISDFTVVRNLNVSGASIVGGLPLYPTFIIPGFASAATTTAGLPLIMPRGGNWESFTVVTRTPVSTASLTLDINNNQASIFNTIGRPNILGAGTFSSTASIATKAFVAGDVITCDIDTGGSVADITIIGKAI